MDSVSKLRLEMRGLNVDGFFSADPINVRYISGFTGGDSFVLVTENHKFFITDARYTEQAQDECPDWEILNWRAKELPLYETIKAVVQSAKLARLGFESTLSYERYSTIEANIAPCEFAPLSGVVEKLRSVKTEHEIACLRQAADIAHRAFERLLEDIKPGVTEKYLVQRLTNYLWEEGGEAKASSPILLSGARTSLLHGIPSDKKVEYGEQVLMDFGAVYKGYLSDISKTVVVGKASEQFKEMYEIEKQALISQINAIKAGVSAREPYFASIIPMQHTEYHQYHYDKVGHGIGLFVHEVPFMSPKTLDILQENNVITVEPGMYIPGWGGVRIEDMVLVTKDGCEVLNKICRDLIVL